MIERQDLDGKVLFDDGDHKFIWLGGDPDFKRGVVQTNQFLIIDKGRGMLLDPGGVHLFARVVSGVSKWISLDKIDSIFFSHQDPDVSSGIALWLGVTKAKIYLSSLWIRFMPHFGIVDFSRMSGIEESGKSLTLPSGAKLDFIPSHFLHSTGNWTLFDTRAKILFSGDIGASVFNDGEEYLFVDDFASHVQYIKGFHERYMASNSVLRKWAGLVRRRNPAILAPQHGAIYRGDSVNALLLWFEGLKCGIDLLDSVYGE